MKTDLSFVPGRAPDIQRTLSTVPEPVAYTRAVFAWWLGYDVLMLLVFALVYLHVTAPARRLNIHRNPSVQKAKRLAHYFTRSA